MSKNNKLYIGCSISHNCSVSVFNEDGKPLFVISEERLSRKKLHIGYPWRSMRLLKDRFAGAKWEVCFARMGKMKRVLRTFRFQIESAFKGIKATPFKPFINKLIFQLIREQKREDGIETYEKPFIDHFVEHHTCHAASAYYQSGMSECEVMTLDGVGNYLSCTFSQGKNGELKRKKAYFHNDVTIGTDYEVVTAMLGFNPLRHPGKITGLAAYGDYNEGCIDKLGNFLKNNWNGKEKSYYLSYFDENNPALKQKGIEEVRAIRRDRFDGFSKEEMAYAIQYISEKKTLDLIRRNIPDYRGKNIALAGGVFANVKLNQKIHEMGFKNVFVQPAMDDGGLAIGAPLSVIGKHRKLTPYPVSSMLLGMEYENQEVRQVLDEVGIKYIEHNYVEEQIAKLIADGKVVARFNGNMEFGPRALGNRSILYKATDKNVNDWLNKQLGRTEFMPFAPVTLWEEADRCYKNLDGIRHTAKFMTITVNCTAYTMKTTPAVVHVDGTARPQLIQENDNKSYYNILKEYFRLTGIPTLVNTSFNMHEEPIVATPKDAIRSFQRGHLDCLAINNFIVLR